MKISGEGRVKESITRTSRAPSVATVGSICDLNLKIPGEHEGLMGQGRGAIGSQVHYGRLIFKISVIIVFLILVFTEAHSGKRNLLTRYLFLLPNENSFVASPGGDRYTLRLFI